MDLKHYLRFGTHAESKYFQNEKSSQYDSIIFNGNMVAYTQSAVAAFIIGLHEKAFIIDPQTHAFQHDPSNLKSTNSKGVTSTKKSIEQLANHLQGPVLESLSRGTPVVPGDFKDKSAVTDLVAGTLDFQSDIIHKIKAHKDWEYLRFKLEATGGEEPSPAGLIAPYFYMTLETYTQWLPVNITMTTESLPLVKGNELMAQLVISSDILRDQLALDAIIEGYAGTQAGTILVWIDGFDETKVSLIDLKAARHLFSRLKDSGKKVVNLYGGYYSLMLGKLDVLDGVSHGLEYGESRAVVPVGGGIPIAKYYFYPLHQRMKFAEFLTIYHSMGWGGNLEAFSKEVCDCDVCKDGDISKFGVSKPVRVKRGANIITLNYPTQATKDYSLLHYLHSKNKEFEELGSKNLPDIIKSLSDAREKYELVTGLGTYAYIDRWIAALK